MADEAGGAARTTFERRDRDRLMALAKRLDGGGRVGASDGSLVARLIEAALTAGVEPDRSRVACFACEASGVSALSAPGRRLDCAQCSGTGETPAFWPRLVRSWACDESFGKPIKPHASGGEATYVKVRPLGREHAGRAYLGILVGDVALSAAVGIDGDGHMRIMPAGFNAVIYVYALRSVVYGMESDWAPVSRPEDLADVAEQDRGSAWYVQALRKLLSDAA